MNQARAVFLCNEATRRWLVKDELMFLLLHYKTVTVPLLRSVQFRPPSGTLLFYNTLDVSEYKKDGWHWQKRKDKSGRVREDRAKLVINREVIVLGTYVHSAEISTFHRRIYYMRDSMKNIVLVHYLDEMNKGCVGCPVSTHVTKTRNEINRSLSVSAVSMPPSQRQYSQKLVSSDKTEGSIMNGCLGVDLGSRTTIWRTASMDSSDAISPSLKGDSMDGTNTGLCADEQTNDPNSLIALGERNSGSKGRRTFRLAEISDFSPDWDFEDGGAKVLICLAASLPKSVAHDTMNLFVQFGTKRTRAEIVSDTVLRCIVPSCTNPGSVHMYVCHWREALQQEAFQLSQQKKFTYRSYRWASPSLVDQVAKDEQAIDLSEASVSRAVHSASGMGKRSRTRAVHSSAGDECVRPLNNVLGSNRSLSTYVESDLDERQCKIRVVERLSEFHQVIQTKPVESAVGTIDSGVPDRYSGEEGIFADARGGSTLRSEQPSGRACLSSCREQISSEQVPQSSLRVGPPVSSTSFGATSTSLDDCAIEAMSDNDLEQLSEKLLERVVRQLVTVAHTSEELLEELNSLDEAGLSLLHYVSFYNYSQLVLLLLAHGAQINQQSTQGQTALHLAAGCGHDQVIDVLQQSGADLQVLDFEGLTAADRADKSGHADVAAKLYRCMGDGTPIDASVVDEVYGTLMEIDGISTPYMDAGDMGLLEGIEDTEFSVGPPHVYPNSCKSPYGASLPSKTVSRMGETQEHNRKLLLGAFSTMSLHDKCALSLSISRESAGHAAWRHESIAEEDPLISSSASSSEVSAGFGLSPANMAGMDAADLADGHFVLPGTQKDSDVHSVIADNEESLNKLQAAMELMGPEERQLLEDEVKVLQHGIRTWLLKRNCRNMRETTIQLREATQSIEQQEDTEHVPTETNKRSERERAAITVQAATRTMLARRSFLQTKHVAIKLQAATRGVLCRKHFARMKTHALASLVIQRNVREWWNKQPTAARPGVLDNKAGNAEENEDDTKAEKPSSAPDAHERALCNELCHNV
uniref:CG-1 domain-containing protein n=1 Tax=Peronospora matthiolae TaxID=2874970 RepID=A0AAV1V440_9STRA